MAAEAEQLDKAAVVRVAVVYGAVWMGQNGGMLMVSASGTAVKVSSTLLAADAQLQNVLQPGRYGTVRIRKRSGSQPLDLLYLCGNLLLSGTGRYITPGT
jgi:hypothetical protein